MKLCMKTLYGLTKTLCNERPIGRAQKRTQQIKTKTLPMEKNMCSEDGQNTSSKFFTEREEPANITTVDDDS